MNFKFWKRIRPTLHLTPVYVLTLLFAEIIGTGILIFVGCLGCVHYSDETPRPLIEASVAFGFAVMMAIQCVGHISGAHLNPVITIGAAVVGLISVVEVPIYFIGQCLGSLAGFGLVRLLIPETFIFGIFNPEDGICATGLNPELTPVQGLVVEFIISFILVTVGCSVWDYRNALKGDTVGIRFGLTVAAIGLSAGPFTSAHMNPARTLGPAVINGYWKHNWIYWVGPLFGSFAGSCFYSIVFSGQLEETK